MPVTCQGCGSLDLELAASLPDGRRQIRCIDCGHEWIRGERAFGAAFEPSDSEDAVVLLFQDDDEGFRRWLITVKRGFFVNAPRSLGGSGELILHRKGCSSLDFAIRGGRNLTKQYVKVCSTDKTELDSWSLTEMGRKPKRCSICDP